MSRASEDSWNYTFKRIYRWSWVVAVLTLVIYLISGFLDPVQFYRSYLVGFVFWLEISLGCFAMLMIYHLTGGYWGVSVRGLFEAGGNTLLLMALLFVPIPFGLRALFRWSHPNEVVNDPLLQHQSIYLNANFFVIRAFIYFAIWIGFYFLLRKAGGNKRALSKFSSIGLILYCFSASYAAYDWIMSLENEWNSTIFGMIFFAGHGLSAMAFVILFVAFLSRFKFFSGIYPPQCMNDLGNILFVFVMLWAYLNFSQLLIIWAGNKPEELEWYYRRVRDGWQWLANALALFQFGLPFFLLLFRRAKRTVMAIAFIAGMTLFMRLIDVYWTIIPGFEEHSHFHWMDILSPVTLGALWIAVFMYQIIKRTIPQSPLGRSTGEEVS